MADALTSEFPDFPEACRRARELEKNLLTVKQSALSGTLSPEGHEAILPAEFDAYNYSFLLAEAQKIERRLFMVGMQNQYSAQPSASGATQAAKSGVKSSAEQGLSDGGMPYLAGPRQAPSGKNIEDELRRFATGESAAPANQYAPPTLQKQPPSQQRQEVSEMPAQPREMPLQPPELPTQPSETPKQEPKFSISQSWRASPPKPPAIPKQQQPKDSAQAAEDFEPSEQKQSGGEENEEEKFVVEREAPSSSMPDEKPQAATASSRLSPRLRAIIEEKLRRQDERRKKEAPVSLDVETPEEEEKQVEGGAQPEAVQMQEEQEIVMSSRERLLKKLQREKPAAPSKATPVENEDGGMAAEKENAEAAEEKDASAEKEELAAEKSRAAVPQDSIEKEELQEMREPLPAPEPSPLPFSRFSKSGLQIKPIFPGDDSSQEAPEKSAPSQPKEENERMRRIQKIIEDLSADKYRAGAIQPSPAVSEEEGRQEQEISIQQEPSVSKVKSGTKKSTLAKLPKQPLLEKSKAKKFPTQKEPDEIPEETELPKTPVAKPKPSRKKPEASREEEEPEPTESQPADSEEPVEAPSDESRQDALSRPFAARGRIFPTLRQAQAASAKQKPPAKPGTGKRNIRASEANEQSQQPAGAKMKSKQASPLPSAQQSAKAQQKTYVPPVKSQLLFKMRQKDGEENPAVQNKGAKENAKNAGAASAIPKKIALDMPLNEEKTPEEIFEDNRRQQISEALQRKLSVSMESQVQPLEQKQSPAPRQAWQEASQEKPRQPVSQPPLSFKKSHDIAGEAVLPPEEGEAIAEDEIPKPPSQADSAAPKSVDYEKAKEGFKLKIQEEEEEKSAPRPDDELEQYAKENIVWLYEIYKMGGMAREDFISKVREKMGEHSGQADYFIL